AGYALARFRFAGRNALLLVFLATQMFPAVLLIAPLLSQWYALGLIDTYQALIYSNLSFTVPFPVWMLVGYFDAFPRGLEARAIPTGAAAVAARPAAARARTARGVEGRRGSGPPDPREVLPRRLDARPGEARVPRGGGRTPRRSARPGGVVGLAGRAAHRVRFNHGPLTLATPDSSIPTCGSSSTRRGSSPASSARASSSSGSPAGPPGSPSRWRPGAWGP